MARTVASQPRQTQNNLNNSTSGRNAITRDASIVKVEAVPEDHDLNEEGLYDDEDDEGEIDDEDGSMFVPRQTLLPAKYTSRPLDTILNLMNSPYLDLSPDYQRGLVWSSHKSTGLIDSLMENYYIPPVIFNVQMIESGDGESRYKRICVDGKQRLSSIYVFMNGEIPCHDNQENKWYFKEKVDKHGNTKRSSRRILPENIKEQFRRKEIVCYEFHNLNSKQEKDLFQRVQLGVPLTPAEKFHAQEGPWQDFAKLYERDFPHVINLSDNSRSSGFRNILTCFAQILETEYPSTASGIPTLRSAVAPLTKFLGHGALLNDKTKSHLRRVFTIFNNLIDDNRQTFQNNGYRTARKFAPIEMVAVAVLISKHGVGRSLAMLHGDIRYLREFLRERHTDLRANGTVWNDIWEFIDDLESYRGTTDGSTVPKKAKPKGRQTRVSKAAAGVKEPIVCNIPKPAHTGDNGLEAPVPSADTMIPDGDDEDDEDYADPNTRGKAMLNQFMTGGKKGAEPTGQDAPCPVTASTAIMSSKSGEKPTRPALSECVATMPNGSAAPVTQPVTNSKRRARLDLDVGSGGARALAAKKARLA